MRLIPRVIEGSRCSKPIGIEQRLYFSRFHSARFSFVPSLLHVDNYNVFVVVSISVNSLNSGGVQICVAKPQYNPHPGQTYPSVELARQVLLDFGIEEKVIDETLKLLPEVGPNQALYFSPKDVPQHILGIHGFRL